MFIRVLRILSVFVLMVVLLTCSDALAQRGGRGGQGGFGGGFGGFGGFGGGTSTVAFVQRDDVQKEIKLSSSQLAKIEALAEDGPGQGRGGFGNLGNFRDMSDEERQEALARIREEREEQQQEQRKKVHEILNADQKERLKELEFQYAVQQGRLESALAIANVDLSGGDRDKLQDAQRAATEEIREQMAKIQLEVQSAALAKVLDAGKIEDLMGKAFTFEQQQPRFGGGGRGGVGRGGPGGRQGRGGDNARPGRPQRPGGDGANPRRDR